MQASQDILDFVDAYLARDLSHDELYNWLLESADLHDEAKEHESDLNLWARVLNLLCLLHDEVMDEYAVRQELQAIAASRPASTSRIEITKSLIEHGGGVLVWDVLPLRSVSPESEEIPGKTDQWAIVR